MKVKVNYSEKPEAYQYQTGAIEFSGPEDFEVPFEMYPCYLTESGKPAKDGFGKYLYWINWQMVKDHYFVGRRYGGQYDPEHPIDKEQHDLYVKYYLNGKEPKYFGMP